MLSKVNVKILADSTFNTKRYNPSTSDAIFNSATVGLAVRIGAEKVDN